MGLVALASLGFVLAVGGTIALPVGGGISLLWPAVAVQFVLALWFGWAGVAVAVLFPLASNLLVADPLTALAFTPANAVQSAIPLLLFRTAGGSVFLRRGKDTVLLALGSVLASSAAAVTGVAVQTVLGGGGNADPLVLATTWAVTNSLCGFALSWPMLRWVSPVLWEAHQVQKQGAGTAFGFHLVGAAFTLTGAAVAVAVAFHALKTKGIPLPESSLAGILAFLLLPAAALGVRVLWRFLAAPLEDLLQDTENAFQKPFPAVSGGPKVAEFLLLRQRFAEVLAALKEQKERFQSLFEAAAEPILLVDPQGRLLNANPAFQRVFGVPAAKARGRDLLRFLDTEARTELQALLGGEPPREPVTLRAKVRIVGRGFRQIHLTAAPWRDAQGHFAGYCVVTTDITREEEAEARDELASRLASLQHLLAGLAHEGNNILQAGVAVLEQLSRHDPEEASRWQEAWGILERAHGLVRRVALLAGVERQLQSEVFPAASLVEAAAAGNADLDPGVRVEAPPGVPAVRGDRLMLRQAVEAVVRNALEATRSRGTVVVRFFEKQVPEEASVPELVAGRYLVVEVADEGHGIRPEHLPHIFDPFFTTRDRTQHQGVGLTLARAAAVHAGGTVTVQSTPGQGTRVQLWLPVARESAPEAPEPPVPRARILLVDDDSQVRQGLEQALSSLGVVTVSAAGGRQALKLLEAGAAPDAVILDLLMPEVSGFEVLEAIRQRYPEMPVVLSSGFAPDERLQAALQNPKTFYLQKPFTLAQLEAALARVLAKTSSGA